MRVRRKSLTRPGRSQELDVTWSQVLHRLTLAPHEPAKVIDAVRVAR